jgi:hypothetical protein
MLLPVFVLVAGWLCCYLCLCSLPVGYPVTCVCARCRVGYAVARACARCRLVMLLPVFLLLAGWLCCCLCLCSLPVGYAVACVCARCRLAMLLPVFVLVAGWLCCYLCLCSLPVGFAVDRDSDLIRMGMI